MAELPECVDRDILEGRMISAVKAIRELQGCSLHDAIDILNQRWQQLHPGPSHEATEEPRGPRVLRFESDGSLVVVEGDQKPKK
ncbi:hypothetical protein [Streptacidiphilus melanogenes]|uniref:hypothetical protein n=1 Tax=Streptacidiphilus melanogenes TaxID=411235 RepID=UPI0005A8D827|nr:hypothetical protein [Streptacidiphilus melanogenes]